MDKTHSRYGDLLDKAMRKKEDRMLASAKRMRDNINAENEQKEQEKLRREYEKEADRIEEQNRQQETLDFANAMLQTLERWPNHDDWQAFLPKTPFELQRFWADFRL